MEAKKTFKFYKRCNNQQSIQKLEQEIQQQSKLNPGILHNYFSSKEHKISIFLNSKEKEFHSWLLEQGFKELNQEENSQSQQQQQQQQKKRKREDKLYKKIVNNHNNFKIKNNHIIQTSSSFSSSSSSLLSPSHQKKHKRQKKEEEDKQQEQMKLEALLVDLVIDLPPQQLTYAHLYKLVLQRDRINQTNFALLAFNNKQNIIDLLKQEIADREYLNSIKNQSFLSLQTTQQNSPKNNNNSFIEQPQLQQPQQQQQKEEDLEDSEEEAEKECQQGQLKQQQQQKIQKTIQNEIPISFEKIKVETKSSALLKKKNIQKALQKLQQQKSNQKKKFNQKKINPPNYKGQIEQIFSDINSLKLQQKSLSTQQPQQKQQQLQKLQEQIYSSNEPKQFINNGKEEEEEEDSEIEIEEQIKNLIPKMTRSQFKEIKNFLLKKQN